MRGIIKGLAGDYEGAAQSLEENAARHGPVGPPALAWLATSYRALGRQAEVDRVLARLAAQFPQFRVGNWNFLRLIKSPEERQRVRDRMIEAGLPE